MLKIPVLAVTLGILAVSSPVTHANDYQQMMEGMLQFQRCMTETVDASYLEKMEAESEKINNQLSKMCNAGKRKEAQEFAMDYAKKMLAEPNFIAMQACVKQVGNAIPGTADQDDIFNLEELEKSHVCDQLDQ